MQKEIKELADVELLVKAFYNKVLLDELLAPHFAGIDFEHHFPRMIGFWAFILLDIEGYKGSVMEKHSHLAIGATHFDRWVQLFTATVDELFTGEKAILAKQRAILLGHTFKTKF